MHDQAQELLLVTGLDLVEDFRELVEGKCHHIKAAEQAGYHVLIIHSLSHAWAGTGGILDIKDRIAKSGKNMNYFTAWREATPKHNELVDTILASPCHVIATLRTKTAYEVVQEEGKKAKVTKLGLAFVQREGLDFEFTVVLDLSVDGHVANSTKDRTGIFDGQYIIPGEETGRKLLDWLNGGEDPRGELIQQIDGLIRQLNLQDLKKAYWSYAGNRYQAVSPDQLDLSYLQEQLALLTQCWQNPSKLAQFQKHLVEIVRQQAAPTDGNQSEVAH